MDSNSEAWSLPVTKHTILGLCSWDKWVCMNCFSNCVPSKSLRWNFTVFRYYFPAETKLYHKQALMYQSGYSFRIRGSHFLTTSLHIPLPPDAYALWFDPGLWLTVHAGEVTSCELFPWRGAQRKAKSKGSAFQFECHCFSGSSSWVGDCYSVTKAHRILLLDKHLKVFQNWTNSTLP